MSLCEDAFGHENLKLAGFFFFFFGPLFSPLSDLDVIIVRKSLECDRTLLIPNSDQYGHQPFLFFLGKNGRVSSRSCLLRGMRMSTCLAHLATRWHCSHKEVRSRGHSSAVALREV